MCICLYVEGGEMMIASSFPSFPANSGENILLAEACLIFPAVCLRTQPDFWYHEHFPYTAFHSIPTLTWSFIFTQGRKKSSREATRTSKCMQSLCLYWNNHFSGCSYKNRPRRFEKCTPSWALDIRHFRALWCNTLKNYGVCFGGLKGHSIVNTWDLCVFKCRVAKIKQSNGCKFFLFIAWADNWYFTLIYKLAAKHM